MIRAAILPMASSPISNRPCQKAAWLICPRAAPRHRASLNRARHGKITISAAQIGETSGAIPNANRKMRNCALKMGRAFSRLHLRPNQQIQPQNRCCQIPKLRPFSNRPQPLWRKLPMHQNPVRRVPANPLWPNKLWPNKPPMQRPYLILHPKMKRRFSAVFGVRYWPLYRRVRAQNCSSPISSARAVGGMSHAVSIASISGCSAFSDERSILRR